MSRRLRVSAIAILMAMVACCTSARQRTIHAAAVTMSAAADGFDAYDAERHAQILRDATSEEDGIAKLAAYKARRDAVLAKIAAALHAIAVAAVLDDKPASLATVVETVAEAQRAWEALKGSP